MRMLYVLLTALGSLAAGAHAQITNSGFENWIATGSYEEPAGWATSNPSCAGPFYSCTKSTDHFPAAIGNYSIRLENNTALTQQTGAYGMAITDTMAYPFKPAFPVTGPPATLNGYYKYNPLNNDTMFIRMVFFQNSTLLGYNTFKTGTAAASWTPFTLPLAYPAADSATLYFSAFYPSSYTDGPNGNSVLYVDNLSFDSLVSAIPAAPAPAIGRAVFCSNPVRDQLRFIVPDAESGQPGTLALYTTRGEIVLNQAIDGTGNTVNISRLQPGVYLLVLDMNGGKTAQRIIKAE